MRMLRVAFLAAVPTAPHQQTDACPVLQPKPNRGSRRGITRKVIRANQTPAVDVAYLPVGFQPPSLRFAPSCPRNLRSVSFLVSWPSGLCLHRLGFQRHICGTTTWALLLRLSLNQLSWEQHTHVPNPHIVRSHTSYVSLQVTSVENGLTDVSLSNTLGGHKADIFDGLGK